MGGLLLSAPTLATIYLLPNLWVLASGALAGTGTRWLSRDGEYGSGRAWTAVAAAMTVTLIFVGGMFFLAFSRELHPTHLAKIALAREIAVEMQNSGTPLTFFPGRNPQNSYRPEHFPEEVWRRANEVWPSLPEEDRRRVEEGIASKKSQPRVWWDMLLGGLNGMLSGNGGWIFLAQLMAAYYIGWGHAPERAVTSAMSESEVAVGRRPSDGEQPADEFSASLAPNGDSSAGEAAAG